MEVGDKNDYMQIDFGVVRVDESRWKNLRLMNFTKFWMRYEIIKCGSSSEGFQCFFYKMVQVKPGAGVLLPIRWTPKNEGRVNEEILVTRSDGLELRIKTTGFGSRRFPPLGLGWGEWNQVIFEEKRRDWAASIIQVTQ